MFSISKGEEKIALIKGGLLNGEFIYINNKDFTSGKTSINLKDGKIVPLPKKNIVDKIYICGVSGSGKSSYIGEYMKQYKKMFRDSDIYLYSSIEEDKVLDKHNPIRIDISDIENIQIEPFEFENSLVIFDDTNTIKDKEINNAVMSEKDWLLEQGRHFNIRLCISSHLIYDGHNTRRTLNEATQVVIFPKSSGLYQIKQFLKNYCGYERDEITNIINLKSRWVCINRTYPQYIIYDKGIYIPQIK
jgi:hypothetical protein